MEKEPAIQMVMVEPGTFQAKPQDIRAPEPHEVRVRVLCAGVCGTDLALFSGQYPVPLPCVMGHEFVGVIEEVGADVHHRWVGRRVAVEINVCDEYSQGDGEACPTCGALNPGHCDKRTVIGIIQAPGAFARYLYAPVSNLHVLPDSVDDQTAVLVEPVAAAIQTFVMCPLDKGHRQRVVVLGAGRLGLLIIAVAASEGAEVIAVSRTAERLELARKFGAHHAFQAGPDLESQIRSVNDGKLADIVVEVTGNPAGLGDALKLVRPRGTVCLKTTVGEPSVVDLTKVVVDEIQLSASRCGPFAEAIHFLERHPLPLKEWIRASYPLEQLSDAMEEAKLPGKVLLNPWSSEVQSWPLQEAAEGEG